MQAVPFRSIAAATLFAAAATQPAWADGPSVVATIKPVHSLTAAVMDGVAEPALLIRSGGSPHTYALRPSEARALESADVVIWVGEALESFLERPLETLASDARIVTLSEADGLMLLEVREGGAWDSHDHGDHAEAEHHDEHAEHEHHDEHDEHAEHAEAEHHDDHDDNAEHAEHDHAHEGADMHVWLDPRNAAVMARAIADALIAADPANAPAYRANLAQLQANLTDLEQALGERLEAIHDRPFVVFHDAYQYFETRFDVMAVGSITVSPEVQPGAARLRELRHTIEEVGAHCVFSEPQFEPRLVETVTEGTDAKPGTLDPLGAELPAGPGQYFALMEGMAGSLIGCLGGPEAG